MKEESTITFRLTSKQKLMIKHLVGEGKYVNISSFVRQAIRNMLSIEGWEVEP